LIVKHVQSGKKTLTYYEGYAFIFVTQNKLKFRAFKASCAFFVKMKNLLLVVIGLVLLAFVESKGVIEIDEISFDRIVDGSHPVLVSFNEFGWKNPKDYEKVAAEFKGTNVIVAKVDCKNNEELKQKFQIESYPAVRFFAQGQTDSPLLYNGADNSDDVIDFVRVQLSPKLLELRALATQYMNSKSTRSNTLAAAESIVNGLDGANKEYAAYFVNSMKKIQEKGEDFVNTEKDRLQGLVNSPSATDKKKNEFSKRLNVLNQFVTSAPVV